METNEITRQILDSAIMVHKIMGPGLLESIYEVCLKRELELRGLKVDAQVPIPVIYKGEPISKEFKIDLLVENEVIVELKAVEAMLPVFDAQIISYLKL
ncbi:MAG TPA: GxxExxY protein, partial [Saprospirales bacterium]|nr:GxxExxY protein [Saprospirales bacterium]